MENRTVQQKYYQDNKEYFIAYATMYNEQHKEEHKKSMRKYVKKNKDKIVSYNKEYKKNRYHTDAEFRTRAIVKNKHSSFLNGGNNQFNFTVGLSLFEYKSYIETILPEGCDWSNYKKVWNIGRINNELNALDTISVNNFFNYKNVKIKRRLN